MKFPKKSKISTGSNELKCFILSQFDIELNLPMVLWCLMGGIVQMPHAPIFPYMLGCIAYDVLMSPLWPGCLVYHRNHTTVVGKSQYFDLLSQFGTQTNVAIPEFPTGWKFWFFWSSLFTMQYHDILLWSFCLCGSIPFPLPSSKLSLSLSHLLHFQVLEGGVRSFQ